MPTEAEALAASRRGAMVAAAGCGKTRIIVAAVAQHGGARELILTHTHAGVDAIRKRLEEFRVSSKKYQLDTIAGWSLRLTAAFPRTSALSSPTPNSNPEYKQMYEAAARLLTLSPIQEIVRASYSGVFVDEYQDCTLEQHAVIVQLRESLSCRVVGDPLQGIFGFGDSEVVDWDTHVRPGSIEVIGPTKPWRWAETNPALGDWLVLARQRLEQGEPIEVTSPPVAWVDGSDPEWRAVRRRDSCFRVAKPEGETVIAIHRWPAQAHNFASRMNGAYSCVEAMEAPELFAAAAELDQAHGLDRARIVLEFACTRAAGVAGPLGTIRTALAERRVPRVKKFRAQLDALVAVSAETGVSCVEPALKSILCDVPGVSIYRRELLSEFIRGCEAVAQGEAATLSEACWIVRSRTRHLGRRMPTHAVGTPQLVKGLQFEHAVILDGDEHDAKNLYVALTRASKTLTIISKSRTLRPISAARAPRDRDE